MNRLAPQDVHAIALPLETHWQAARCEDIDCVQYLNGWQTIIPGDSPLAGFIKGLSKTHHWKQEHLTGGLVAFTFPPGQQCFRGLAGQHRLPNGRPPLFVRKVGDRDRQVVREGDWVDSLHETTDGYTRRVRPALEALAEEAGKEGG